jgi:hypothetical protein
MNKHRRGNSFIRQYTRENYILQNNRNVQKIIVLPHKIYGTKERRLSERAEAQKCYGEAIERFIAAYQLYEKIGVLLQKAKVMGDLAKIEYLSYLYMENVNNLMYSIDFMDQQKRRLNTYIKDTRDG